MILLSQQNILKLFSLGRDKISYTLKISSYNDATHNNTCCIRTYQFLPDDRSCHVDSTRNNCCEFLASDGIYLQSVQYS